MNQKQFIFVKEYLRGNGKLVAYNRAYGTGRNYDTIMSAANRLLRIPEIAEYINETRDAIRHEVEQELKEKYREELLTIYEKRRILKLIATGEMYVEQKYKGKNCTQCSQYISPTINQMLAALREDSKLAGHYPEKRTVQNHNKKQQNDSYGNETTIPDGGPARINVQPGEGGVLAPGNIQSGSPLQGDRGKFRNSKQQTTYPGSDVPQKQESDKGINDTCSKSGNYIQFYTK